MAKNDSGLGLGSDIAEGMGARAAYAGSRIATIHEL